MQDSAPKLPIDALFKPRAIALIGVSPKGGAGANILRSGQRFGFSVPEEEIKAGLPGHDRMQQGGSHLE